MFKKRAKKGKSEAKRPIDVLGTPADEPEQASDVAAPETAASRERRAWRPRQAPASRKYTAAELREMAGPVDADAELPEPETGPDAPARAPGSPAEPFVPLGSPLGDGDDDDDDELVLDAAGAARQAARRRAALQGALNHLDEADGASADGDGAWEARVLDRANQRVGRPAAALPTFADVRAQLDATVRALERQVAAEAAELARLDAEIAALGVSAEAGAPAGPDRSTVV